MPLPPAGYREQCEARYGWVASSKLMWFKPHTIPIRVANDPIPYFLNDHDDTRSSDYREDSET